MNETIRNATEDDRLDLDLLFAQSRSQGYIRQADDAAPILGNTVITHDDNLKGCIYYSVDEKAWFATFSPDLDTGAIERLIELSNSHIDLLWVRPCSSEMKDNLVGLTWSEERVVLQMLFNGEPGKRLDLQAFDGDLESLVELNNIAFYNHPDQQNKTIEEFEKITTSDWFDPSDLRVLYHDGAMAGFCWTRIASKDAGEIYLLALHPDMQGKGFGRALVNSGIHYLRQKVNDVYLHVDSRSERAVKSYTAIGFETTSELRLFKLR